MTAEEIAFELGSRLLKANLRVSVMTLTLNRLKDQQGHVRWQDEVEETFALELQRLYDENILELRHTLSTSTESNLLSTLQKYLDQKLP